MRDAKWLARKLQKEKNLEHIDLKMILKFIQTSAVFTKERHDYEQKIVKWQINYMVNGGEGWICDDSYGGSCLCFHPLCDIGFRKAIRDTLLAIGMDEQAIEEGIEANADLWRNRYISMAFDNQYDPLTLRAPYLIKYTRKFESPAPEHKKKWIKMRVYEYYQNHTQSVDKYGTITPEMQMSNEEIIELTTYLKGKNKERITYIDEFEKEQQSKLESGLAHNTATQPVEEKRPRSLCKKIRVLFKKHN